MKHLQLAVLALTLALVPLPGAQAATYVSNAPTASMWWVFAERAGAFIRRHIQPILTNDGL